VTTPAERAAAYWDERHANQPTDGNYLGHPLVVAYTSLRAVGSLVSHLEIVIAELRDRTPPGARVFSPACGTGGKEIALAQALPDRSFVACDIAAASLDRARETARCAGLSNIEFVAMDANDLDLGEARFDAVVGMGGIHHVERLEAFWSACRRGLRRGGLVMGQEYIGANRLQWTPAQVEEGNRVLRDLVPPEHRVHHDRVKVTPVEEMLAQDPSEAVRSQDILPTLRAAGFDLMTYASGGGAQVHTYDPRRWDHNLVLARLFAEEDRLMREGRLGDDFCMFVTHPLG
jgi:SAM-dependent methyltransferase